MRGIPGTVIVDPAAVGWWGTIRHLVTHVKRGDAVLLNGAASRSARWVDYAAGIALRYLRPRVFLVITDATWHARAVPGEAHGASLARLVEAWGKALSRGVNGPRTHFCVLSRSERHDLIRDLGVTRERVHFTPFPHTIWHPATLDHLRRTPPCEYVFAGGNASRDYRLLLAAVDGLDVPVRIATAQDLGQLPANVKAGRVAHDEFMTLMAGAAAVVVPLATRTGRGAGQQTYLNAMHVGRLVIVTDAVGVRDYLTDRYDALIVPPDPRAVREAIEWVYDPANQAEVEGMIAAGRETAHRHRPEAYHAHLVHLARTLTGDALSTSAGTA